MVGTHLKRVGVAIAVIVALYFGLHWIGGALNDPELEKILDTPLSQVHFGHFLVGIFLVLWYVLPTETTCSCCTRDEDEDEE